MNYCLSRDFCQEVEVGCKIFLHRNPRAVQSALKHLLELLRHAWPCRKLRRAGLGMDKDAARPTQQVLLVHGQVSDVIKSCQHVECSCEGFSGREAYLASGPSGLPLPGGASAHCRGRRGPAQWLQDPRWAAPSGPAGARGRVLRSLTTAVYSSALVGTGH